MKELPKILNLSAVDYGGAGNIAVQYHKLFKQFGYESVLIVKDKKGTGDALVYKRTFFHKIKKKVYRIFTRKKRFDPDYLFHNQYERLTTVSAKKLLSICPFKPDVILLYWISDFINAEVIRKIYQQTNAKIFWFMIDNAPITGGCHYPLDCRNYENECEKCPAIISRNASDFAHKNLLNKKLNTQDCVNLIACSEPDFLKAKKSNLFGNSNIYKLLISVNDKAYKPSNKITAQKKWGISSSKKVLLFGASNFNDSRKGLEYLVKALEIIEYKNIVLLIAGKKISQSFPFECILTGVLNEEELIIAYQASDIFLSPSTNDSGPMMVNQALMCGTPVVAFNIGVAMDIVLTGKTGYRAKKRDFEDFAKGIDSILSLKENQYLEMCDNCRKLAIKEFGYTSFLNNFNCILKQ